MSRETMDRVEPLVREAGAFLKDRFGKAIDVMRKSAVDLVTDADHGSEAILVQGLKQMFPADSVIAEESGQHAQDGAHHRWIVDPLDGTVNFAHGIPHFCVLLARQSFVEDEWQTDIALTYEPLRDSMYSAVKDGGAWRDGTKLSVSSCEVFQDAMLSTGFAYDRLQKEDDNHAEFCRMNLISQGVRRFGSAGLDLAWVAAGHFDAFWEYGLYLWDYCGGLLLVEEAGGRVVSLEGREGSYLASAPGMVEPILDGLKRARGLPCNSREGLV